MTHYEEYLCPNTGHWIKARAAKKALYRLADRLDALECHDRARFIRSNWQRTAARPSLWAELLTLVTRWEQDREAAA
jgi:hypothetical protein